jgi:hypothetical protein
MIVLWLLLALAVALPGWAVTVTTSPSGKIEICDARELNATLSAVVYGADWDGAIQSDAHDLDGPPVSATQRSLAGTFGRWGPQLSFREALEAKGTRELHVRYDLTARASQRVNALCVVVSLPRARYAGATVAAYSADGARLQSADLPVALRQTFLLSAPEVSKVEIAPGTPHAFTLLFPEPLAVGMQDNLTWGGNDYELRLNALPAGEGREIAEGDTFALPLAVAFPAAATFALDPAMNVSRTDSRTWIPYTLPWNQAAVDISWLNEKPAGRHGFLAARNGHFIFEDGTPVRFWGAVVSAAACFPTHEQATAMAARMAGMGINLVRLTHLDAFWCPTHIFSREHGDTQHYDPEMFDRLDYFFFSLKQHGIYVYLDNLVSRRFTPEDGVASADALPMAARPYALFDPTLIALERKYSHDVWTHVNPYTGLAYKDDPVIAITDLLNENDLNAGDVTVEPYASSFDAQWREWAAAHHVNPDQPVRSTLERGPDVLRFIDWLQRRFYADMHQHLRDLGVRVPITGDAWLSTAPNYPSQATMDFLDAHAYWDHPTDDFRRCRNTPELTGNPREVGLSLAELSMSKVEGKPMVVSEWGHPWPNEYRLEGPLWKAAVGSLQGWDALLAFEYAGTGDLAADYLAGPFDVGNDPEVMGLFPAAALLFRRGDVRQSPQTTSIHWTEADIFHKPPYGVFSGQPAYRALVEATTLATALATPTDGKKALSPFASPPAAGKTFTHSDTGEFRRDWEAGVAVVDAPRSQGAFGQLPRADTLKMRDVSLRVATPFAAVMVTSLDGRTVRESRHLLVTAVGRAENTGQVFNLTRTELRQTGSGPILTEPVSGTVTIRSTAHAFQVYARGADGSRTPLGERHPTPGQLSLELTPAARTIYYELEAVDAAP